MSIVPRNAPPPQWETAVIVGGPHNRQRYTVRTDQDQLVLHDGPIPHTYLRVGCKPELLHQDRVVRMFNGGRR